jgi:hypothetical protein
VPLALLDHPKTHHYPEFRCAVFGADMYLAIGKMDTNLILFLCAFAPRREINHPYKTFEIKKISKVTFLDLVSA